jgi:hypothetical protein
MSHMLEIGSVPVDQHVFLIGRPPVGEFLGFVRSLSVDGHAADQAALVAAWRAANDHVNDLEKTEGGFADNPELTPLPESLAGVRDALVQTSQYQKSYGFIPNQIAIVELDKLVVFQKHIDLSFVNQLRMTVPADPSAADLFSFCFSPDTSAPRIRFSQTAPNRFTFMSPSNDLRFLEANMFAPQALTGLESAGRPVALIGLVVGYGSNLLNAFWLEDRLVLNNGSHRAYALREHGVTHAPCIIQKLTRRDELELVTNADVAQNPDRYFKAPRPPVLKDYFDPKLRQIIAVARKQRTVQITFGIDVSDVPA